MPDVTKKQLILELFERSGLTELGEPELRRLQQELSDVLRPDRVPSRSYIARVLRESGRHVSIADVYSLPEMEDPYAEVFSGILKFATLEDAETTLKKLSTLHTHYKETGDRKGMGYARAVALVGLRRARSAGRRTRSAETTVIQQEIAQWFSIWLETPGLFSDWLELRKRTEEYHSEFGPRMAESDAD